MAQIHVDYNPERKKFLVSFNYSPALLDWIKRAPEGRFSDRLKAWELPSTIKNSEFLKRMPHETTPEADACFSRIDKAVEKQAQEYIRITTQDVPKDSYIGHVPKTTPFEHQVVAFNLARERDEFGIFFEQGLGKTKVAIDLAEAWMMSGKIDKVIILCPNFVKSVWKKEIQIHATQQFPSYVLNGSEGNKRFTYLDMFKRCTHGWLILNYEELITKVKDNLLWEVQHGKILMIADESTRLKNRAAKTVRVACDLSKRCEKRLILTGTPITNNPLDYWAQFIFLRVDMGFSTFTAFRNHYAVMGGFERHEIIKFINLDDLKKRVAAFSLRKTKEECLDLPEKVYQPEYLEMQKDHLAVYETMRKEAALELEAEMATTAGKITAANVISKMLRLSQIAGGTLKLEDGSRTRLKWQPKLDRLLELLKDEIEEKDSVIIWARFTEEIRMIGEALTKAGITNTTNYGETKDVDRRQNIDDFQSGKVRVFIGQPHAVGIGVTLTAASYVIYYSLDYSLETRMQSEDRAHRIGQTKSVIYIDLMVSKSIDIVVMKALKSKKNLFDYVVDKGIRPFDVVENGDSDV